MNPLGPVLLVVAAALFLAGMISLYSTSMTFRRSRVSPWAITLLGSAVVVATLGVAVAF
ncbi:hypothetical protein [Brachybacterium hainanense]|uniref:Uncharacterized protein n=1 Tax=Brachybacterium hainanense TaxID=1541174 RepID=A0ABV6RBG4_9MICO